MSQVLDTVCISSGIVLNAPQEWYIVYVHQKNHQFNLTDCVRFSYGLSVNHFNHSTQLTLDTPWH